MNRLTEKHNNHYDLIGQEEDNVKQFSKHIDIILDKLGQYEDIDNEIGIDYITLNKLRKIDTIYVKFFGEVQEWPQTKLDMRNCKIWYGYISGKGYTLSQPLSNYGKGFALTKEELEK